MDVSWVAGSCKRDPVLRYLAQTLGADVVCSLLKEATSDAAAEQTLAYLRESPTQDLLPQPLVALLQSPNAEALLKSLVFARAQTLARLESLELHLQQGHISVNSSLVGASNCTAVSPTAIPGGSSGHFAGAHFGQPQHPGGFDAASMPNRRASWQGTPSEPFHASVAEDKKRAFSVRRPSLSCFDPFGAASPKHARFDAPASPNEGTFHVLPLVGSSDCALPKPKGVTYLGHENGGEGEDDDDHDDEDSAVRNLSRKSDLITFSPKPARAASLLSLEGNPAAREPTVLRKILGGPSRTQHLAA